MRILAIAIGTLVAAGTLLGAAPAQAEQDTVSQFVAAVEYTAARYNTGHVPVYVSYLSDSDVIAETNASGITLNSTWAALSPGQFNASMAEDVAKGYTPGGCGGIQGVAIHEMGHVIDRINGRVARNAVTEAVAQADISRGLHGYAYESGRVKPGEAVAVSFQAVECGSATVLERKIYDVMFS